MRMICEKRSLSSIELRIELRIKLKIRSRSADLGKAIEKMQKSMDKMVSKIKSLEKKVSGSSSKKKSKAPTFPRSRSLLTPKEAPCPRASQSLFFRAKGRRDNTQRRRKSSKARRSSSTTGLDRVQTEETQLDRADGRVDLRSPV
ncbi:unnamed protein product [Microthlaspi erraticum]|uniref:Uncharacterized protein n=1 Tax=Microthlaspi erraticum TaxID=1685480 RepID=A0A6D2J4W7_9BRAS|nr:unnamed protein product [Microthlaspi erraticum]